MGIDGAVALLSGGFREIQPYKADDMVVFHASAFSIWFHSSGESMLKQRPDSENPDVSAR